MYGMNKLKSVLSLKTVNKQLGERISALRLGYASQSQYKITYSLPIFSGLHKTSHFNLNAKANINLDNPYVRRGVRMARVSIYL